MKIIIVLWFSQINPGTQIFIWQLLLSVKVPGSICESPIGLHLNPNHLVDIFDRFLVIFRLGLDSALCTWCFLLEFQLYVDKCGTDAVCPLPITTSQIHLWAWWRLRSFISTFTRSQVWDYSLYLGHLIQFRDR